LSTSSLSVQRVRSGLLARLTLLLQTSKALPLASLLVLFVSCTFLGPSLPALCFESRFLLSLTAPLLLALLSKTLLLLLARQLFAPLLLLFAPCAFCLGLSLLLKRCLPLSLGPLSLYFFPPLFFESGLALGLFLSGFFGKPFLPFAVTRDFFLLPSFQLGFLLALPLAALPLDFLLPLALPCDLRQAVLKCLNTVLLFAIQALGGHLHDRVGYLIRRFTVVNRLPGLLKRLLLFLFLPLHRADRLSFGNSAIDLRAFFGRDAQRTHRFAHIANRGILAFMLKNAGGNRDERILFLSDYFAQCFDPAQKLFAAFAPKLFFEALDAMSRQFQDIAGFSYFIIARESACLPQLLGYFLGLRFRIDIKQITRPRPHVQWQCNQRGEKRQTATTQCADQAICVHRIPGMQRNGTSAPATHRPLAAKPRTCVIMKNNDTQPRPCLFYA
jgi:hypothetical protein